jgi:uncharacterized membrane protein YfcA
MIGRMSHAKLGIFFALGVVVIVFLAQWVVSVRRARRDGAATSLVPTPLDLFVGFITNFFDTLGIGSFATTASMFKLWRIVPDERIPGTLNVGHAPPTAVQAFIFIAVVAVEPKTLILMIGASVVGAWLGAGVVSGWSRPKVQVGMGMALLAAAVLFTLRNLDLMPGGGEAMGLDGWRLWAGIAANFVLGALMTLGIGLYAPCMIVVSLLSMNPKVAFPIMMGSCAFLMPAASTRFIREGSYSLRPAVGLALGGIPGVLIAAYAVGEMNVVTVRWLVTIVVVYTAASMLRSAAREKGGAAPSAPAIEGA